MNSHIDYHLLSQAIKIYHDLNYKQIEVPWLVGHEAYRVTTPHERSGFELIAVVRPSHKQPACPIASAEQGFIQLMLDGALLPGEYMSVSPCFRDEPTLDLYHQTTFIKLELCRYLGRDDDVPSLKQINQYLNSIRLDAMHVHKLLTGEFPQVTSRTLDSVSFDLEYNGIEVGSYGYRCYNDHCWIYGTGLALPRMSLALKTDRKA